MIILMTIARLLLILFHEIRIIILYSNNNNDNNNNNQNNIRIIDKILFVNKTKKQRVQTNQQVQSN